MVILGHSATSKKLGSKELRRFRKLTEQLEDLGQKWVAFRQNVPREYEQQYDDLLTKLRTKFPSKESFVLPTRFGNAIGAFEDYPREIYGADPIPLWIHLNTVMPKEFQSPVEESRISVTFLMNLFLLSTIISFLSLCKIVIYTCKTMLGYNFVVENWYLLGMCAFVSAVIAWMSYNLSVEKAYAWGTLVKAAFDCYLPALAEKLGYSLPLKGEDQKQFWTAISRRAAYHRELKPEDWPRLDALKSIQCNKKIVSGERADDNEIEDDSEGRMGEVSAGDGGGTEDESKDGADDETYSRHFR
jgi:hypothetical protein